MFREISNTYQTPGAPRKRWFSSADMDLFVWFDNQHNIVAYHLTYNKQFREKALLWSTSNGFSHTRVDDGANPGKHPMSPVFVNDKNFEPNYVVDMLLANQGALEANVKAFIISGINEQYLQKIESQ